VGLSANLGQTSGGRPAPPRPGRTERIRYDEVVITGEILATLRRRVGRTQADVAAAAGIPASVLSAYERGRREPSLANAARIIDALGYSVKFDLVLDPGEQARRLHDVLDLAEALPYRPRRLASARR
jgi:transcriptional regulator with XRE-family HTH domain